MSIVVDATYEGSVLKPTTPLSLKEHEQVRAAVEPTGSLARQTADMLPWIGDSGMLHRLAEDIDFGLSDSR